MSIEDRISILKNLGSVLTEIGKGNDWNGFELGVTEEEFNHVVQVVNSAKVYNGWFEVKEVQRAFLSWGAALNSVDLKNWTDQYNFENQDKTVGIIMAGNIPLVGLHDLISVYVSGNISIIKLSSDDPVLIPAILKVWKCFDPQIHDVVKVVTGKFENFDAVICTGSNNTARYFEEYFGKYPNIIRKSRTSVAIIDEGTSQEELAEIGHDIFDYYGLGCRNVTKLYLPEGYDLNNVFGAIFPWQNVTDNKKYGNNYDYHKAVFLMEQYDVIENGFILFKQDDALISPIGTLYYDYYSNKESVESILEERKDQIQCVVGKNRIPFGQAQHPKLWDYADGVDTLAFLANL